MEKRFFSFALLAQSVLQQYFAFEYLQILKDNCRNQRTGSAPHCQKGKSKDGRMEGINTCTSEI
jgi:hypothetical protein